MKEFFGKKCYTRKEVADILGVSVATIDRNITKGTLRRQRIGMRTWISEQSLKDFIDGKTTKKSRYETDKQR